MEDIRFISQWFEREEGAGLVLPDGWYGRPFDNLLNLISIERDAIVLLADAFVRAEVIEVFGLDGQRELGRVADVLEADWDARAGLETREADLPTTKRVVLRFLSHDAILRNGRGRLPLDVYLKGLGQVFYYFQRDVQPKIRLG